MKRVISVWLPHLATDRLCRQEPAWRDRPLATVTTGTLRRLVAVNRPAARAGLRPGSTVADAQALVPDLRLLPTDPAAEAALLDALADRSAFYTPWASADPGIEGVEGAGLWLDITGCAHLFGGEQELCRDLLAWLRRQGFTARAAAADTPGAAWAWARFSDPKIAAPLLPPGGQRRALADLPVQALRLDPSLAAGLTRLGLRRIGDLYGLPRAALATRFGLVLSRRLDQALGRAEEPLSPRRPPVLHRIHVSFGEPISRPEDIAAALATLLDRLVLQLEQELEGARRLEVTAFRVDSSATTLSVGTSGPSRDPRHLHRLLAQKLDKLDAGFGIELLRLAAVTVEPLPSEQGGFPLAKRDGSKGEGVAGDGVAQLLDVLANRLGADRVIRVAPQASHLPERAVRCLAPGMGTSASDRWPPSRRPLRLFRRPEAVEAVAPLPDSPPLLFRWRNRTHRLVRAEGPERIGAEWWRAMARDRDYYWVEDESGRRFWLYREGFYGGETTPRWFLHGLFS